MTSGNSRWSKSVDESVVGIEDGDLVFLSTAAKRGRHWCEDERGHPL